MLQRPRVLQYPGILAITAGKSHPHPCTLGVTPNRLGLCEAGMVCGMRLAWPRRDVQSTGSRSQGHRQHQGWDHVGNRENLNYTTPVPCWAVMLEVGTGFLID